MLRSTQVHGYLRKHAAIIGGAAPVRRAKPKVWESPGADVVGRSVRRYTYVVLLVLCGAVNLAVYYVPLKSAARRALPLIITLADTDQPNHPWLAQLDRRQQQRPSHQYRYVV